MNINLNINNDDKINGVKIERYISIPVYENGELKNFENTYYDTIELVQPHLVIEKISDYMYMKLKLDTLPAGYGSTSIGYFVAKDVKSCEFEILEIETCNIEINENDEMDIIFMSADDKVILSNYELTSNKLSDNQYSIEIITSDKTFYNTIQIDEEIETNHVFSNACLKKEGAKNNIQSHINSESLLPFTPEYSNYELFQNSGSRFIVVYNPLTMDINYVQKVAYYIECINAFFCENPNNFFPEPKSMETGEYCVYLYNRQENSSDNALGYTSSTNRVPNENGSYISLMYEIVSMEYQTNREDSFSMVLAHEYFHSICYTYSKNISGWISESFANFGGLLFINSIKKGENFDAYTLIQFSSTFKEYLMYSRLSIDDCSEKWREYDSFLLPLYIYQKFGMNGIKEFLSSYSSFSSEFDCFDYMLDSKHTTFSDFYISYVLYNIYPYLGYDEIDSNYKDSWDYYNYFNNISIEDVYELKKPSYDSYDLPYYSNNVLRYSAPKKCNQYNVYYTVELSNYAPISIYQIIKYSNNTTDTYKIDINSTSITIPLSYEDIEQDVDNIAFAIINNSRYSSPVQVSTCITVEHKIDNIQLDEVIDVGQHLHKSNAIQYLKFVAPETDIYEINFEIISSYDYLEVKNYSANLVKVLDEYKNVIYKYKNENTKIETANAINCKNIVTPLEKDKTYYLRFNTNYQCNNLYVTIKKVDIYNQNVDLTNADYMDIEMISGDCVYKIQHIYSGFYKINLSVESNNEVMQRNLIFVVFYKQNGEIKIDKNLIIHSNGENNEFGLCVYSNREYYIGMLNCQDGYKYTLSSNIRIESTIQMKTDINENVSIGSEVYLNNGDYNGRTITEGYTRVIYLFKSNVNQSRLDYDWYSLDENKVRVSSYGTVTAMPIDEEETSVKILAVNKKTPSYASFIEFKIKKDYSTGIKKVKLTTDVREGGTPCGTEVTINGGSVRDNTIHVGYTRLICFDENTSPSDNIQDYIWSSSNEEVVTVSQYGTVKVISNPFSSICGDNVWQEVTITGIYKYNNRFVATLVIKVKR